MYLDTAEITKEEDVLITTYKPGVTVSQKDAFEIDNAHLTLCGGSDVYVLVNLKDDVKIDLQAKEFFAHKGKMLAYTKAVAIVGSEKNRGNFFAKLFKRSHFWYDVKKFKSEEDAMKWFDYLRKNEPAVA